MGHALSEWILGVSGAWWAYPVIAALCLLDAVVPIFPSESVLVGFGSLVGERSTVLWWLLILVGWCGAALGDHAAYAIGRAVGYERFRFFREGRGARAVAAAERGLERHAFTYIMTARFIPLGRTAVNLTAGAIHYPRAAFTARVIPATGLWAAYSVGIGMLAGRWFHAHPLAGLAVALVFALVMSFVIERGVHVLHARLNRHHDLQRTEERSS